MQIVNGGYYKCENEALVVVEQISESLAYRFKAVTITGVDACIAQAGLQERWMADGTAYHYDCGWSIVGYA